MRDVNPGNQVNQNISDQKFSVFPFLLKDPVCELSRSVKSFWFGAEKEKVPGFCLSYGN